MPCHTAIDLQGLMIGITYVWIAALQQQPAVSDTRSAFVTTMVRAISVP